MQEDGEPMPQGTIIVEVKQADRPLPVAYAQVTITSQETGDTYSLVTDISGKTTVLTVPAPPREASLRPESAQSAFSRYTVAVTADGFAPVRIVGVQVFPDIESIVPVRMTSSSVAASIPVFAPRSIMAMMQVDTEETVIEIPEPAVLQPTPRNPVGPPDLRAAQAFSPLSAPIQSPFSAPVFSDFTMAAAPVLAQDTRVFRTVYIPEAITVHLGAPGASARNVTVPFVDYIKNVASSEIFPTWPENALRSNIHAQVGFALNRVFTEWYPSRGYNFNITNTTAYDQAFVEGRNIYGNISELVDEIFNVYPRREGRLEPLFSAFCNGSTTTCNGLSQWGTVTLADRGYKPLEMLQYYYGDDVELVETDNIRGITASYPGYLLRRGSQNEYVRALQRQLLRIRRDYPAIPAISSATGYFGPETEAAVRAFQQIFNLSSDGIVGPTTWYALSRVYTGVTGLGEIESEGLPLPDTVVPYPGRVLRQGSKGDAVRTLQRYLNDLASAYGALLPVNADGTFGNQTRNAVLAFQQLFDLTVDGIVGPATWNKLMQVWDAAY